MAKQKIGVANGGKTKVYTLDTDESLFERFQARLADGIILYATKQLAEEARAEYEDAFGAGSARIVELDVVQK